MDREKIWTRTRTMRKATTSPGINDSSAWQERLVGTWTEMKLEKMIETKQFRHVEYCKIGLENLWW